MNVYQKVIHAAQLNPAAPAFISAQGCLTYSQFISLVAFTAQELYQKGVVKGDVVGITVAHIPLHAAVVVAIAQLGAVSISLNKDMPAPEMAKRVQRFSIRHIVRTSDMPKTAGVKDIEFAKINFGEGQHTFDLTEQGLPEAQANDPARFLLTSGSTGESQAILHTQASWVERIRKTVDEIGSNSRVAVPDVYSTLGNIFLLGTLFAGAALVLVRTARPEDLMMDISAYGVTHLIFPPHFFSSMLPYLPRKGIVFPNVQHLRPVGSSLSQPLIEALLTRISPNVYFPYGMSEAGVISMATPSMLMQYPDTSGKLRAWSQAEIIDENEQVLPQGQAGQIRVKIEGMTKAYYQSPQVSESKFRDGWFYTTDYGYFNEEGLLFIQGRMDDLINLDGRKFFPVQLEAEVVNVSAIAECVFFTTKVGEFNQLFGAFVASQEEITQTLRQLPYIQALLGNRYFSVKSLPRNTNGKILRKDLASTFAKEISAIIQS